MLTVCKHLLFNAPRIGTYDRICLKGFGMEQFITQLAVKILFDDYSGFYDMRRTIILPEKQKLINDIVHVYDLDKDWFRIFTLERDIY